MPIGDKQLQTLLNLAHAYPEPLSQNKAYSHRYLIPTMSRKSGAIAALVKRALVEDKPLLLKDGRVKSHQYVITNKGWFALANFAKQKSMWHKRARQWWRENGLHKTINYILPPEIKLAVAQAVGRV